MIVAALFGMASKFAEIGLGIKYREVRGDGSVAGGAIILFGFSCLSSYYTYAERAIGFLFGAGKTGKFLVKIFWLVAILVGSQTTLGVVWDIADTCNGLMIIPNLIALLLLSKEVIAMKNEYFA